MPVTAFRLDGPVLDRGRTDHLAFCHGIHHCADHTPAGPRARSAIEAIFRRLPGLRRAGPPERTASPVLRSLRTLPVSPKAGARGGAA
ncbi:hypothetical protein AB0C11_38830 [Streptomyces sp. NPDC039016]|uniref:hypothetical protein n=1 Tax=Streptomyces sp. NPDC039016 TaxID=3154330 RepID=UPI0034022F44